MIKYFKEIFRGKGIGRIMANFSLVDYELKGVVVDIGGGEDPSYLRFFRKAENFSLCNIDFKSEKYSQINLEKDNLPFATESVDQILMFNILEHIYNYNFLVDEVFRIIKSGGEVIGYVPFLINYHPDPHDFWRYTNETLEKIFTEAGFKEVKITAIGFGPWLINYNNIMVFLPKILRIILFPFYYALDWLFLKIKPDIKKRFPLGYLFIVIK
jgi:SAM-dependent methyltransferase